MHHRSAVDIWSQSLALVGTVLMMGVPTEIRVARLDSLTMKCPRCEGWFEFPATLIVPQGGTLTQVGPIVCTRCGTAYKKGRS